MAKEYLGETIDIHCGGLDLVFPHHENERAQSESLHGTTFVRYWVHIALLNIDKVKMSNAKAAPAPKLRFLFVFLSSNARWCPLSVRSGGLFCDLTTPTGFCFGRKEVITKKASRDFRNMKVFLKHISKDKG